MRRIALDSTVLVSAFLTAQGAAAAVLTQARAGHVAVAVSEALLRETARVLLEHAHIRHRYQYPDAQVHAFCQGLAQVSEVMPAFSPVRGVCRAPEDDRVLAGALAAAALYLLTRDKDLLVLQQYEGVTIVTPETFLAILRAM